MLFSVRSIALYYKKLCSLWDVFYDVLKYFSYTEKETAKVAATESFSISLMTSLNIPISWNFIFATTSPIIKEAMIVTHQGIPCFPMVFIFSPRPLAVTLESVGGIVSEFSSFSPNPVIIRLVCDRIPKLTWKVAVWFPEIGIISNIWTF